jgi:phosphohistidine phosphatase
MAGSAFIRRAMKRVYLLRHARSSWKRPELPDHDRPLAGRGKRATKVILRHMRAQEFVPELVLCSTARRARETLERIEPALGGVPVRVERELYGASARELLARLRRLPDDVGSVLVIGHNPGMHELGVGARRLGAGARGQVPHGGAGHARVPRVGLA